MFSFSVRRVQIPLNIAPLGIGQVCRIHISLSLVTQRKYVFSPEHALYAFLTNIFKQAQIIGRDFFCWVAFCVNPGIVVRLSP